MTRMEIEYLGKPEIDQLGLTNEEILSAVEMGLVAAGRGQTVIEPRTHLTPDPAFNGHFNVLRGYVAPLDYAGVKVVGDFVDNYKQGLPSELALLNLFCPRTGAPKAVIDAAGITDMRTGALTALGAKWLGPAKPKILGHLGARGTSYWNVRLLDHLFDFDEIRVHSRRPESRDAFARNAFRRPRQKGHRDGRLGILLERGGYPDRSHTAGGASAAVPALLGPARRSGGSLRYDEYAAARLSGRV